LLVLAVFEAVAAFAWRGFCDKLLFFWVIIRWALLVLKA
jgi:hypothetical protein